MEKKQQPQKIETWHMEQKKRVRDHKEYKTFPTPAKPESSLAARMPELAAQWDTEKNAPLMPEQVMCGSRKKVWWRCARGHSWQAVVKSRSQGAGCPICANREIIVGLNDWASRFPAVAMQWDAVKNGCTPEQVRSDDRKRYWWLCGKGHSWQATIRSRINTTHANGCPYCAGRRVLPGENDLKTQRPDIAAEWDVEKNAPLKPSDVTPGSNKRVFWRCRLGHSYQSRIGDRTVNGHGCPYCTGRKVLPGFNDLKTFCPQVAEEWHPILNGALQPTDVTRASHRKIWWLCHRGHEWNAMISSRTSARPSGCPYCAREQRITKKFSI